MQQIKLLVTRASKFVDSSRLAYEDRVLSRYDLGDYGMRGL